MTKSERLEDLGRIRELLSVQLDNFTDRWDDLFDSKHSLDRFYETVCKNEDKADDLHRFLRFHKEKLEEIYYIALGDIDE